MPRSSGQHGVLALDIGTSSVRAIVYDQRGQLVEPTVSDVPYRVDTSAPGQVSSDADRLVDLVARAIDRALRKARKAQILIDAVATSCYWHSLLGIDAFGRPTTEVLTWADTRSAGPATALRGQADEHRFHERTGAFFHASFWPSKLRWLQSTRPGPVRRTVCWIGFGEYLYERLLGQRRASVSMASGTGLLDVHTCDWDPEAVELAGVSRATLPAIADWDEPMSGLRPQFGRRWPVLRAVPWYLPLGDGALANVGAGCVQPAWVCATLGTSGALRVILERGDVTVPWGAWTYRLDRRHFVLGGALSEGGNVIRWLTVGLGLRHRKRIEEEAARLGADQHGLTILPFWAGERSPNWRSDARAVIAGLSLSTRPDEIVRAAMEAITYQLGYVFNALRRAVSPPRAVVATGGRLVHSPAWEQMLADVLNVPVIPSSELEASSRGAALLALHALGRRPGLWREAPAGGRPLVPRANVHRVYAAASERQAALYDALFPPLGRAAATAASGAPESGPRTRDLRNRAARR